MPYICENQLNEIYGEIEKKLKSHGITTEKDIMRDYLLRIRLFEDDVPVGRLIVDYSPKRKSHSFRKGSDLSEEHFKKILSLLNEDKQSDEGKSGQYSKETEDKISGIRYHAYVDGSFLNGRTGYGAVILDRGDIVVQISGSLDLSEALSSRQVGGEIQAVIQVLEWCKKNNVNDIAIFYDFENIEKWATGKYQTNTPMTRGFKKFFDECKVNVVWVKVKSHAGILYNEMADELAKKGAVGKEEFEETGNQTDKSLEVKPVNCEKTVNSISKPVSGWIIYNASLLTPKFIQHVEWFVKAAEESGIELKPFTNDHFMAAVINGKLSLTGSYTPITRPDFVIFWDKDIKLARHLEKMGLRVFNSSETITICDDKFLTHQILAGNDIPMPLTIPSPLVYQGQKIDESLFLQKIEKVLDYPVIVKESFGSFGAQVYMAKNRDELLELRKRLIYVPHIYQEYIKSSYGRDVRIQVVGGKVAASMLRTSDNGFKANITSGGHMTAFNPPREFKELALKAALLVKADFAGVDILFGENENPILCEINSNAHMKNIMDCTGVDIAREIIEYIKNKI
jgi:gamma-F420-2:alpha-L-glutamate ligase